MVPAKQSLERITKVERKNYRPSLTLLGSYQSVEDDENDGSWAQDSSGVRPASAKLLRRTPEAPQLYTAQP
jgi:hypothetical protein